MFSATLPRVARRYSLSVGMIREVMGAIAASEELIRDLALHRAWKKFHQLAARQKPFELLKHCKNVSRFSEFHRNQTNRSYF